MSRRSKAKYIRNRVAGITTPIRRKRTKWERNWPCLCGSGKKYKSCCMDKITEMGYDDNNATVEQIPDELREIIDSVRAAKQGTEGD